VKGLANSLLIVGEQGIGKTELVLKTLRNVGLEEGRNFLYVQNYLTPLSLYQLLQRVNELENPRIIVLDDIEETINNQKSLGIFKGALWSLPNGKREVCWYSTTSKIKVKKFEFKGRIIFILNSLKLKNSLVKALIDRGFFYNIQLTNREKLELIKQKAKEPYANLTYSQRMKVVECLMKYGKNSKKLSLRILPKAYNLFILSPNHYQKLIRELL